MLTNSLKAVSLESTIKNFKNFTAGKKYRTIYADPPWQFQNRTGKVAPEHKRLSRYPTMKLDDIKSLPVADVADEKCHLYLWVPNALLPVMNMRVLYLCKQETIAHTGIHRCFR